MGNLYHYTTVDAFQKIMTSSLNLPSRDLANSSKIPYNENDTLTLHLSHIRYLNDSLEYKYLCSILWKAIEKTDKTIMYNQFDEFITKTDLFSSPFVLSLSKHNDYLPMWQMYSNNATGVMLAFDKAILTRVAKEQSTINKNACAKIGNVSYTDVFDDTDIISKCISAIHSKRTDLQDIMRVIDMGIIPKMSLYKSKAYSYEKECRLNMRTNIIYTKVVNNVIKQYTDIAIPAHGLKAITLGPCMSHKEEQKKAIEQLLSTKIAIGECPVYLSSIDGFHII